MRGGRREGEGGGERRRGGGGERRRGKGGGRGISEREMIESPADFHISYSERLSRV